VRKRPVVIVNARPSAPEPTARQLDVDGRVHALMALGDAALGELRWLQPAAFRREWQLVSDRGEHLLVRGHGLTGRRATVETPNATWELVRSWAGQVSLAATEGRPLARVVTGWLGGSRIEPAAGPALVWRRHWRGHRTLADEEGHELLGLRPLWAFLRWQCVVTLTDAGRQREDLVPLLAATFFDWLSQPRGHAH